VGAKGREGRDRAKKLREVRENGREGVKE